MRNARLIVLLLLMTGCTREVPLAYAPTEMTEDLGLPRIGLITTVDQRGESDPTWIGAVRGGFGNSLKALHTKLPLADMVTAAFREALLKRGLYARDGSGDVDLSVAVIAFESMQYVRREATVDLVVTLRNHATGQTLYRDEIKVNPVQGSVLALDTGVFGSSDDLQAVAQKAMSQAIDAALDKPGFATALRTASGPVA